MKVKKIIIQNLKALSSYEADFNWCSAIVTGGNNKWKSTLLKSLVERIQWIKWTVKKWEEKWFCEYELTDWSKFIWELKSDWKEKLSFITKEWLEVKTWIIKTIGKEYFWEWFDVDEFLNSTPQKQKRKLEKLLWIDMFELDMKYKNAYDIRTEKNTIYKTEKAKIEWVKAEKVDMVDISKLQDKILEIEKKNQNISYVEKWLAEKEELLNDINKQIDELEKRKKEVGNDIEKWKSYIKDNKQIDTQKIKEELERWLEQNKEAEKYERIQEQKKIVEQTKKEAELADEEVKEIEQKKKELLTSVAMPEWFDFDWDKLLYNWYELDKSILSSSSIYIASLKLATMWLWEIKSICFDASYLDKNSLEEIQNRAEKEWLQLLIERPDYDWWEVEYKLLQH